MTYIWQSLLLVTMLSTHGPAAAQPSAEVEDRTQGKATAGAIEMNATKSASGPPVAAGSVTPTAVTVARYVPGCFGNSYSTVAPIDTLCDIDTLTCGTAAVPGRMFFRYVTTIASDAAVPPPGPVWTFSGPTCRTPEQAAVPEITVTLADFRRLPLPASTPDITKDSADRHLIRARMNADVAPADTQPSTYQLTLLGTPVTVRATPAEYEWDFGDGSTPLRTTDPGAPYPHLTTWHVYQTPGDFQVTLTTHYRGEYSVNGGPFQPIAGTAEVVTAPEPVTIWTATNRLVG